MQKTNAAKRRAIARSNQNWQLHVMLILPLLALLVYNYLPMAGIVILTRLTI